MYDCQSVCSPRCPSVHVHLSPISLSLSLAVCLRHPLCLCAPVSRRARERAQAYREGSYTYRDAYVSREWRQDPRRHVTGAPLLCRREFAPDEAALRQQTATGVSRQAPVVLSTLRYILRGRRARGQSTLDDRHSRSSIVYSQFLCYFSNSYTSRNLLTSFRLLSQSGSCRTTNDYWAIRRAGPSFERCAPFKSRALPSPVKHVVPSAGACYRGQFPAIRDCGSR